MEAASAAAGAAGLGRRGDAGHAGVGEAPALRSVRTSKSRACSGRLRVTEEKARKQGKVCVRTKGAEKKRGPGVQRASGRVLSGKWMSAVRLRRSVLGFTPCTRVEMQCEALRVGSAHRICKSRAKGGVRAAGRDRGGIMASRSVRGAAAVPGRSSVEARAGPELRIIDLYWGHVDLFFVAAP